MDRFNLFKGQQEARSKEVLVYFKAQNYTTTERDAMAVPQTGQIIMNTTTGKLNFYTGSAWEEITST